MEFEKNVLTEIFPVLVDSICLDARKMVPPPPPPKGAYKSKDGSFGTFDSLKMTKNEKKEYNNWKNENERLKTDTSKVIIALNPFLEKIKNSNLKAIFKNEFNVSEIYKSKFKEVTKFRFDFEKIKLNQNFKIKNLNEFPKTENVFLYDLKYNFVFSGILEVSRIEFDSSRKFAVFETGFSYCGSCGRGYLIYLRKENNKWKIYKMEDTWIS